MATYPTSADGFESASLQDMQGMLAGANPQDILDRADALESAAKEMEQIGNDLMTHVQYVEWSGESAQEFREWGHQLGKNTVRLADYTSTVSKALRHAGSTMSDAKRAMPPTPSDATLCYVDPTKETAANASLEAARQEAIPLMNKVSDAYWGATFAMDVDSLAAPNFGRLPAGAVPEPIGETQTQLPSPDGAPRASAVQDVGPGIAFHGGVQPGPRIASSSPEPMAPRMNSRTHLDAVSSGLPTPDSPAEHSSRPDVAGMSSLSSSPFFGAGVRGPRPSQSSRTPLPEPAEGAITGGKVLPIPDGQNTRKSLPAVSAGDEGIVGGLPLNARNPSPRLPRGVVVGEEPLTGSSASNVGASGFPRGIPGPGGEPLQRLPEGATEAGTSAPPIESGYRGEYTSGGTGLQQPGTAAEPEGSQGGGYPMAPGGVTGWGGRSSQRRARPDYLVEDQETWSTGRDVVPPVIE
jgi:uncharacterized protein YukE